MHTAVWSCMSPHARMCFTRTLLVWHVEMACTELSAVGAAVGPPTIYSKYIHTLISSNTFCTVRQERSISRFAGAAHRTHRLIICLCHSVAIRIILVPQGMRGSWLLTLYCPCFFAVSTCKPAHGQHWHRDVSFRSARSYGGFHYVIIYIYI